MARAHPRGPEPPPVERYDDYGAGSVQASGKNLPAGVRGSSVPPGPWFVAAKVPSR